MLRPPASLQARRIWKSLGEAHGSQSPKIRLAHLAGKSCREVAAQQGVAATSIYAVLQGRTWKHVK